MSEIGALDRRSALHGERAMGEYCEAFVVSDDLVAKIRAGLGEAPGLDGEGPILAFACRAGPEGAEATGNAIPEALAELLAARRWLHVPRRRAPGAVAPHAVEDDGELASDRNAGAGHAAA